MAKSHKDKGKKESTKPVKAMLDAGEPKLPKTREKLLELHRETRARRNAAPHGSEEHRAAIDLIGRIEVEVARIERAMDPPRG
jgi:hypothetical protein